MYKPTISLEHVYSTYGSQLEYSSFNDNLLIDGIRLAFNWNISAWAHVAKYFIDLTNHEDQSSNHELYRHDMPRIYQPLWNLNLELHERVFLEEIYTQENEREKRERTPKFDTNRSVSAVTNERFAWYVPAHFKNDEYGIHFDASRIRKIATQLGFSPLEDAMLGVLAMTFWHEIVHAWIEDLCSLAESISGQEYYLPTVEKYDGYILMEEAIANTGASGMLKMLLANSPAGPPGLLSGLLTFMKNQPPGYCDYVDLRWWCTHDVLFQRNVIRLLKTVYRVPEELAYHAVRIWFEPTEITFPLLAQQDPYLLRMRETKLFYQHLGSDQYIKRYGYPLFVH